jgi:hypothetical protein
MHNKYYQDAHNAAKTYTVSTTTEGAHTVYLISQYVDGHRTGYTETRSERYLQQLIDDLEQIPAPKAKRQPTRKPHNRVRDANA